MVLRIYLSKLRDYDSVELGRWLAFSVPCRTIVPIPRVMAEDLRPVAGMRRPIEVIMGVMDEACATAPLD
jgi:hypothetical protein